MMTGPLVMAAVLSCSIWPAAAHAAERRETQAPAGEARAATGTHDDLSGVWERDFLAGSFAPPGIPSGGSSPGQRKASSGKGQPPAPPAGFADAPPGGFAAGQPPGPPPGGFPGNAPPGAPPGVFPGGPPPGGPGGGNGMPMQKPLNERVPTLPDGTLIPLKPQYLPLYRELEAKRDAPAEYSNTKSGCKPLGTPENMMGAPPYPIRIVQKPNFIAILLEEGWYFRTVYVGGKHPEESNPSFNGHSIAHWEGKTLVVETVALRDESLHFISLPHSPEMKIIERIRRTAPDRLEDRIEIDDPVMYSKPFTFTSVFKRTPQEQIEYVCEDHRTP